MLPKDGKLRCVVCGYEEETTAEWSKEYEYKEHLENKKEKISQLIKNIDFNFSKILLLLIAICWN